jgi:Protein kinase domain
MMYRNIIMTTQKYKFLNQGTFGCIYSPDVPCEESLTNPTPNSKYAPVFLSKIQIPSEGKLEQAIGKQVLQIPNYKKYFAPIESICNVDIGIIQEQELEKCKVFKETQYETTEFTSNRVRYVGDTNLSKYLKQYHDDNELYLKKAIQTHLYILEALQHLYKHNIIHYDLKSNNIVYDDKYGVPILIDFGLSFNITTLSPTYDEFYTFYEKHPYWCIDVILLSYISKNYKDKLDAPFPKEELINVVEAYINTNEIFEPIFFTKEEMEQYKQDIINYLNKLDQENPIMTTKEFITTLIQTTSHSWDMFAITVMYMFFLESSQHLITQNTTQENGPYKNYNQYLKSIILKFPNRPTANDAREELIKIITPTD